MLNLGRKEWTISQFIAAYRDLKLRETRNEMIRVSRGWKAT